MSLIKTKKWRLLLFASFTSVFGFLGLIFFAPSASAVDAPPNGTKASFVNAQTLKFGDEYYYSDKIGPAPSGPYDWLPKLDGDYDNDCPASIEWTGDPKWHFNYQDKLGDGTCSADKIRDIDMPSDPDYASQVYFFVTKSGDLMPVKHGYAAYKHVGNLGGSAAEGYMFSGGVQAGFCRPMILTDVIDSDGETHAKVVFWRPIAGAPEGDEDDKMFPYRSALKDAGYPEDHQCRPGSSGDDSEWPYLVSTYFGDDMNRHRGIDLLRTNEAAEWIGNNDENYPIISTKAANGGPAQNWILYEVPDQDETSPPDTVAASCSVGALGWLLCPVVKAVDSLIQKVASLLDGLLSFEPLLGDSTQATAIHKVWQSVVTLANIGLAIVFIVIIYSQITSAGISNYGVKKMLPRLLVAAILVNVSFYVCALAIDVFNLIGAGVQGLISLGFNPIKDNPNIKDHLDLTGVSALMYGLIGIIGIGALLVTGVAFLLVPVALGAGLAFIIAFFTLAFRNVLIILLVIASPLAFVAMVLPGTESWFRRWGKTLMTMLALYPILMAIFYGSSLASAMILSTGQDNDGVNQLLALAVLGAPLYALPVVMKGAGGVLGRLGVLANDKTKGIVDRNRKWATERKGNTDWQRNRAIMKQAKQSRKAHEYFGRANTRGGLVGLSRIGNKADRGEFKRLVDEQSTKHFMEERGRAASVLSNNGFYATGTGYEVWDDSINDWRSIGTDTGGAALAIGQNKKVRMTRTDGHQYIAHEHGIDAMEARAAIDMAASKDGSALKRMTGANGNAGVAPEYVDSLMQSVSANYGTMGSGFPAMFKSVDAYGGASADSVSQWHSGGFDYAARHLQWMHDEGQRLIDAGDVGGEGTKMQNDARNFKQNIIDAVEKAKADTGVIGGRWSASKEKSYEDFKDFDSRTDASAEAARVSHLFQGDRPNDSYAGDTRRANPTGK